MEGTQDSSGGRRKPSPRPHRAASLAAALAGGLLIAVGGVTAAASTAPRASSCNWATATSLTACGGMSQLIKAAKAEGTLTVITLPPTWANYGTLMNEFRQKYGITITDQIPDGSSQDELNAIQDTKGTSRAPDVVDVGPSFALLGAQQKLFAPYKVKEWSEIPASEKASNGDWYYDYGGYVSIGYDASAFKTPPTSFTSLTNSEFKGAVALDGNPTQAGAAFAAVFAAALSHGGSFSNIAPGISYFKTLNHDGNFITAQSDAATIGTGQVKVGIDWDYLNAGYAAQLKGRVDWKVIVPSDAHYASYYCQAVSRYAAHPAAARLWEEFLYSNEGQNGFLGGFARPVLLSNLVSAHAVNRSAYAKLPAVAGSPTFPTQAQIKAAQKVVLQQWSTIG